MVLSIETLELKNDQLLPIINEMLGKKHEGNSFVDQGEGCRFEGRSLTPVEAASLLKKMKKSEQTLINLKDQIQPDLIRELYYGYGDLGDSKKAAYYLDLLLSHSFMDEELLQHYNGGFLKEDSWAHRPTTSRYTDDEIEKNLSPEYRCFRNNYKDLHFLYYTSTIRLAQIYYDTFGRQDLALKTIKDATQSKGAQFAQFRKLAIQELKRMEKPVPPLNYSE